MIFIDFKIENKNIIKMGARASKHAAKFVEEDHLSAYK